MFITHTHKYVKLKDDRIMVLLSSTNKDTISCYPYQLIGKHSEQDIVTVNATEIVVSDYNLCVVQNYQSIDLK